MLAREINRLRNLDRRVSDLLAEGLVVETTEDARGVYLARVNLEFDGLAEYSVTAESGTAVEPDERVWLCFPRGDLNATPYVLGGLRPRRTRLALGTRAGDSPGAAMHFGSDGVKAITWRKLGEVELGRYHSTWLAVGQLQVDYAEAEENSVYWSARVDVELAATVGGSPGGGGAVLGRTLSRESVALDHEAGGRLDVGLALRVERGDDERRTAEIWCGVQHVALAELEASVETGSAVRDISLKLQGDVLADGALVTGITYGQYVTSVGVEAKSATPTVTSASLDVELYELG